ncbi:MAG TPA: YqhR family membrane protein [Bacillales bacterium]|nr:YqhR family membrane protein [Bacillales bacterium]
MQGQDRNIKQDNKQKPISFTSKCMLIGFWGGLICGVIGYIAYLMNFTVFGPALVLKPWALGEWKHELLGQIVGIFAIALLSILTSLIYKVILERWYTMWVGVIYGVVLWFVVFYLLNPIFPDMKSIADFDKNTLVTTICIYILYGLFIGYSVSFEYHELNQPEAGVSEESEDSESRDDSEAETQS